MVFAVMFSLQSQAQEIDLSIEKLPLINGVIYKPPKRYSYCLGNRRDGVLIASQNDSCFATTEGVVISNLDLGEEFATIVSTFDKKYITYAGLKELAMQKGDTVKKSSLVGLVKPIDSSFELVYIICNKTGKYLSYQEHLKYLRQVNYECGDRGNASIVFHPYPTAAVAGR
jgi:hypothetical protein